MHHREFFIRRVWDLEREVHQSVPGKGSFSFHIHAAGPVDVFPEILNYLEDSFEGTEFELLENKCLEEDKTLKMIYNSTQKFAGDAEAKREQFLKKSELGGHS